MSLQGRCRKTICPSDHYEEMEQCIPIYNTLTGLDINFKIKVTPEQDVHGKVAIDVAKELKQNVSSHLTNLISLQTRDITVWFLPKIGEKTIRSFLLDIFLYNASKKVKYNRAVLELHDFFYAIKSLNRLQISKDTTLGVTYEMGHKLDYGDQLGNLYHLTGGGLKQYTNTNHLTISDVNWCIRTEFTANETEILGRNVFRVKKTNTFLSKDQCFIDFSVDPIILYTCIDYFVDDGVKGNKNPKILTKVSKTSVNTEHATSKLPLPAVGTVVAVLVAVMLTIMLLKMIYKRRERQ